MNEQDNTNDQVLSGIHNTNPNVYSPGAVDPKGTQMSQTETTQNNEENVHGESAHDEQQVVESSEVQVKDPREPKLKFGPFHIIRVIGIEWLPIIPAAACAAVAGVAPVLFFVVLGGLFGSLSGSDITSATNQAALYMFIIALVSMVLQFTSHFIFNVASQRIGNKVKAAYFDSVTRQEIGFFDIKKAGAIANTLSDDTSKVTDAFSVNLLDFCQYSAQFIVAIILALVFNYAMALLQMIAIPLIFITLCFAGRTMDLLGRKQSRLIGDSVSTANEVISSMKTVRSMAGEEREVRRYSKDLDKVRWIFWTLSAVKGFSFGWVMFCIWGCVALAFFFGGQLIGWGKLDVGNFIRVYGLVLMGIFGLMQVFMILPEIIKGISSSALLLSVIKREPAIRFKGGKTIEKVDGLIEFQNVTFRYPSRPKAVVLEDFNLKIEPGQAVALVGQSGSGKSTIVGLLEKWYEPESGKITLDGHDITELDPMWVHRHIGMVQQEPNLFATSIKRNITYAVDTINQNIKREHRSKNNKITDEELNKLLIPVNDETIQQAAKAANCHEFIMTLPEKYDTVIGERGVSMSGGQKQRVAIARAVLQDPKILLLDEATSALDTKSEALVQDALNKLMKNRTSIVIAHRLTTIQDCDNIVVLKAGKVIETGKHDELLEREGAYFKLAKKQMRLSNVSSSSDLTMSSSSSDLEHSDEEDNGIQTTHQSEEVSITEENSPDVSPPDINDANQLPLPIQQEIGLQIESKPRKKTSKLRRRHEERKKRRQELESFTNEQDIEDPFEPKIKTPFAIVPYVGREWILIGLGAIGSCMVGTLPIAFYLIFGRVINVIIPFRNSQGVITPPVPGFSIPSAIATYAGYLAIVAAGGFIGQFISMFFFSLADGRMGNRIKKAYFKSVVNQELGFFDIKKSGKILNIISEDIGAIQNGLTARMSIFVQYIFQCILGIIFALIASWDTALIALGAVLFLVIVVGLLSWGMNRTNKKISQLSGSALATATEVIGSMRTVRSMGGEEREQNRLHNDLKLINSVSLLRALLKGMTQGTISFIIFADAAFVFYYGGAKVANGTLDAGSLLQVFGFVLFAVLGLSLGLAEVSNIAKSGVAAKEALKALKRKPQIPIKGGQTLEKVTGNIGFENITFAYPSRPNSIVLKNFNLNIESGQHIALVGESGSGKSTIAGLVERFYDPKEGRVLIDGVDLKELDSSWLHRNVGIVTQEPVLFATTIKNNITYAIGDTDVSMERIIDSAKAANCHDFISNLPNGYDTVVGERGVSMSGGQKQRIAIARAMLQNSSILILDEATSALDTESEALVQEALNRLMKGRTTIVIAHRLSTVQDCDLIVAMKEGVVVEKGTHDELIQKGGMYYKLTRKQMEFGMSTKQKQDFEHVHIGEND